MTAPAGRPIGRDDIEAKLREIRGEVGNEVERARVPIVAVGVAVVVGMVGAAYLLGRRRGRRRRTVVEVRRV